MSVERKRRPTTTELETAQRYSEIADAYDSDWRGKNDAEQLAFLEDFISLIGAPPKVILDAGCGTGKDSKEFVSREYSVVSLDLSPGMLDKAINNSRQENDPVLANMERVPLKDETVDGAWSMSSLVHNPADKRKRVIREFHRVLKPNGILHIGVQNFLSRKHVKRVVQSYLAELGYDNENEFYYRRKTLSQILSSSLIRRFKDGYAFLDQRHWFYPHKIGLIKLLKEQGFSIEEANSSFERRLRIFARK